MQRTDDLLRGLHEDQKEQFDQRWQTEASPYIRNGRFIGGGPSASAIEDGRRGSRQQQPALPDSRRRSNRN